jgi:nucleotide-binding universal stress UspA family protein
MYSTVVVPLDGSTFAEEAIEPAAFLARRGGATLLFLRVYEGASTSVYRSPPWNEFFRCEEEGYLETLSARVQARCAGSVDWALLDGHPATAICARAAACDAPLIVMSTHGHTGIRRTWLGSIAHGILRHTLAPVLMLRPPGMPAADRDDANKPPFKNIIVALDGSAFAEQVLPHAATVAKASNARLILLRIVEPAENNDFATRQASAYLDEVARRESSTHSSLDVHVEKGASPGSAILEYAHALARPLIGMASHGRGLSRLFLGSVADEVVRGAPSAVLMVRPPT